MRQLSKRPAADMMSNAFRLIVACVVFLGLVIGAVLLFQQVV
jgi:hypothetical protein